MATAIKKNTQRYTNKQEDNNHQKGQVEVRRKIFFLLAIVLGFFLGVARYAGAAEADSKNHDHLTIPVEWVKESKSQGLDPSAAAWGFVYQYKDQVSPEQLQQLAEEAQVQIETLWNVDNTTKLPVVHQTEHKADEAMQAASAVSVPYTTDPRVSEPVVVNAPGGVQISEIHSLNSRTEATTNSEPTKATETSTTSVVHDTEVKTEEPTKHETKVEPTPVTDSIKEEEKPTAKTEGHNQPEVKVQSPSECFEPFDLGVTSVDITILEGCTLNLTVDVNDVTPPRDFGHQELRYTNTWNLTSGTHTITYPLVSCVEQIDAKNSKGELLTASFVLEEGNQWGPFPHSADVANATKRIPPCHVPKPAVCASVNNTAIDNKTMKVTGNGTGQGADNWTVVIPARNDQVVTTGTGNVANFSFTGEFGVTYRLVFTNSDGVVPTSNCDFAFQAPVTTIPPQTTTTTVTTTVTTTSKELPRTGGSATVYGVRYDRIGEFTLAMVLLLIMFVSWMDRIVRHQSFAPPKARD